MQSKTPGIMGGMGPEATIDFMTKVLAKTKAGSDQEHIRMIVDHDPKVPNRHAAIKGVGEDVGGYLANMAKGLEDSGADFVAMVCNTAHAFEDNIKEAINIPFVSIIDVVIDNIKKHHPEATKVGVMAAEGALEAELYQNALKKAGIEPVLWGTHALADFMGILYQVKSGNSGETVKNEMIRLADDLVEKGAEVLISGCTEIPLILSADDLDVPLVESTSVLVERVIEHSMGEA